MIATVRVGWTSSRPIRVDEHLTTVVVAAKDEIDANLLACQMVACRPECEMATSSGIVEVEL